MTDSGDLPETARKLFAGPCDFAAGAQDVDRIPAPSMPEIAFCGRSNVGKSSLVNALTSRKTLAKVSHTPGRTQQLNFFDLGGRFYLVDMPGHGYAAVSKKTSLSWNETIRTYLRGRVTLRQVLMLIDARHGFKDSDRAVMDLLDESAVSYRIVLTKADEVKDAALAAVMEQMAPELVKRPAAFPGMIATSARNGTHIELLREEITRVILGLVS